MFHETDLPPCGYSPNWTLTAQYNFMDFGQHSPMVCWPISSSDYQSTYNTLRPRQNGRHFADDIFKCIILNVDVWIPIKISLKFVTQGPINIIPALVQIIAWRRQGDKPLSEPMMVRLPTHICVTRPQWDNGIGKRNTYQCICTGNACARNNKMYFFYRNAF